MTADELAVWVTASCERQGIPVKITDRRVITEVAALLTDGTVRAPTRGEAGSGRTPRTTTPATPAQPEQDQTRVLPKRRR